MPRYRRHLLATLAATLLLPFAAKPAAALISSRATRRYVVDRTLIEDTCAVPYESFDDWHCDRLIVSEPSLRRMIDVLRACYARPRGYIWWDYVKSSILTFDERPFLIPAGAPPPLRRLTDAEARHLTIPLDTAPSTN